MATNYNGPPPGIPMKPKRTWFEYLFGSDNSYKGPTVDKPTLLPPPPPPPTRKRPNITYEIQIDGMGLKVERAEAFTLREIGESVLQFSNCDFVNDVKFKQIVDSNNRIFRLELLGFDGDSGAWSFQLVPDNGLGFILKDVGEEDK